MSKFKHRTLTSDSEIRAYLHRTRMDILAALGNGPATASQLGKRLGVHPANLTRHIRTLVEAGLAELVEKRDTGRNLEKYYAATADSFDIAPETDAIRSPHKLALALARSDLSAALVHLPDDDPREMIVLHAGARIARQDFARFQKELTELVESFNSADRPDGSTYHLNISMYPSDVDTLLDHRIELTCKKE